MARLAFVRSGQLQEPPYARMNGAFKADAITDGAGTPEPLQHCQPGAVDEGQPGHVDTHPHRASVQMVRQRRVQPIRVRAVDLTGETYAQLISVIFVRDHHDRAAVAPDSQAGRRFLPDAPVHSTSMGPSILKVNT
jgi:hypothetical protein